MNFLFGFRGRFGRLEWWGVQALMLAGYMVVLTYVSRISGIDFFDLNKAIDEGELDKLSGAMIALVVSYFLLVFWVVLASSIKRYHDRDKSGWWYLIILVPIIGPIWQFIELGFLSGTPGSNGYDSNDTPNELQLNRSAQFQGIEKTVPTTRRSDIVAPKRNFNQKASFGQRG